MVSTNKNLINRILYNFSIFIILILLVNFRTKIMLFYNNKKFFILFLYFYLEPQPYTYLNLLQSCLFRKGFIDI